jgi:HNH endonuclease
MPVLEPSKVKFYKHTLLPNENGCMLWKGALASKKGLNGYGKIRLAGGKQKAAHRFSYEIHKGSIPNGIYVLHKCDTPRCVAPDHLFLGTHSDNMRDREIKKRNNIPEGENNYLAAFKNEEVIKIRTLQKQGVAIRKLARIYKVSQQTIQNIVRRKTYKNI